MESCAPGLTSWNFLFSFFPLYKNCTLLFGAPLFALPCLWVCNPEAVGQGIAIRAKVEQKGRVIFMYWEKIKINIPACQSRYTFSMCHDFQLFIKTHKLSLSLFFPFIWGKWCYQKLCDSLVLRERVNRSDTNAFVGAFWFWFFSFFELLCNEIIWKD